MYKINLYQNYMIHHPNSAKKLSTKILAKFKNLVTYTLNNRTSWTSWSLNHKDFVWFMLIVTQSLFVRLVLNMCLDVKGKVSLLSVSCEFYLLINWNKQIISQVTVRRTELQSVKQRARTDLWQGHRLLMRTRVTSVLYLRLMMTEVFSNPLNERIRWLHLLSSLLFSPSAEFFTFKY